MRTISSSVLVALVVAALFWGNCFSCPQVLFALGAHGCCHHSKHASGNCSTQALRNFVKADVQTIAPDLAAAPEPIASFEVSVVSQGAAEILPSEHAPPDRLALNSSFRI